MFIAPGSLRRILKFLRMTFLIARFCGWWGEWKSVVFFVFDVFSAVSRSISWARCLPVVTTESVEQRFLKNLHISLHLL